MPAIYSNIPMYHDWIHEFINTTSDPKDKIPEFCGDVTVNAKFPVLTPTTLDAETGEVWPEEPRVESDDDREEEEIPKEPKVDPCNDCASFMFNVLAAAKQQIGATSSLKVGCENGREDAKLKFYCETKKDGFLVESNENVKTSVPAHMCGSENHERSVLDMVLALNNAGLSCQPPVDPQKPARKCKISRNTLNILGKNADYYEEGEKIIFFCDVTEDSVHQRKGEPKFSIRIKRGRCPKDKRLAKTLKRRAKGLCESGSSERKFGEIQRQYKPLEHVYGSQFLDYKAKFAENWRARSNGGGIARGGFSGGSPFSDRMSSLVNFPSIGPMARPNFPPMAYSKKPSSKGGKNGKKNPASKAPEKRSDTTCMRKCEPDSETEKHYEKIGTMTCAAASRYTVTCHDGRTITVWWRRNCRKTLLQAEDFCANSN